jgi:hypothetical protein
MADTETQDPDNYFYMLVILKGQAILPVNIPGMKEIETSGPGSVISIFSKNAKKKGWEELFKYQLEANKIMIVLRKDNSKPIDVYELDIEVKGDLEAEFKYDPKSLP